jgi:CubicO group peptidase (beta-lactamase class C family)
MSRFVFLLNSLLHFLGHTQLSTDIANIQQQHDLMGGVVTLYCRDGIIEHIPFGVADLDRSLPVTDSTIFRIASISKTITAMAFLSLVDDGLVDLDDDISSILGYTVSNPNYPTVAISPRMLLSHTSTLIDGSTYSNFLTATYTTHPIPNISELLTPGGTYYTTGQFNNIMPGTYFNYSNINYGVIGTLIEKISGQRFDEYCRNRFFLPMGISGSFNVNHISNINNIAVLYRKVNGNWLAQADNFQGAQPNFTNLTNYVPGTNGARFAPQGGLRCSGNDLTKLMMLLLNKGTYDNNVYLSEQNIAAMLTNEWTFNGSNGNNYWDLFNSWGLGTHRIINIPNADVVLEGSSAMFGHPGEAYGLVSDAYVDTIRNLGIVFMTNGCGVGYQLAGSTAFYTLEKQVFESIDPYADLLECNTLSTPIHSASSLQLYPNPVMDNLHIINLSNTTKAHIFDPQGRLISQFTASPGVPLDLTEINNGLYYLQLESGERFQFIKQ